MPNIDLCEPQMINALAKAGWRVIQHPYIIAYPESDKKRLPVYADLQLQNVVTQQQLIVVEVKCFAQQGAMYDEFYRACGQYAFYRTALDEHGIDIPLYLAVPKQAYDTFLTLRTVTATFKRIGVKLIVVNLNTEEVVQWET